MICVHQYMLVNYHLQPSGVERQGFLYTNVYNVGEPLIESLNNTTSKERIDLQVKCIPGCAFGEGVGCGFERSVPAKYIFSTYHE